MSFIEWLQMKPSKKRLRASWSDSYSRPCSWWTIPPQQTTLSRNEIQTRWQFQSGPKHHPTNILPGCWKSKWCESPTPHLDSCPLRTKNRLDWTLFCNRCVHTHPHERIICWLCLTPPRWSFKSTKTLIPPKILSFLDSKEKVTLTLIMTGTSCLLSP